jgi:xyloglucan:xyloglucosyl transferase
MASSLSSPSPSPRLLHILAVVAVVLLGGRGGEARQPPPLHGVRPMAFGEGYTQIFGSANLALRGQGKRVHLSLDESTGEYSTAPSMLFCR